MRLYAVVDVGCIECGEPSAVLGVYRSRAEAEAVWNEHADQQKKADRRWDGSHRPLIQSVTLVESDGGEP